MEDIRIGVGRDFEKRFLNEFAKDKWRGWIFRGVTNHCYRLVPKIGRKGVKRRFGDRDTDGVQRAEDVEHFFTPGEEWNLFRRFKLDPALPEAEEP